MDGGGYVFLVLGKLVFGVSILVLNLLNRNLLLLIELVMLLVILKLLLLLLHKLVLLLLLHDVLLILLVGHLHGLVLDLEGLDEVLELVDVLGDLLTDLLDVLEIGF